MSYEMIIGDLTKPVAAVKDGKLIIAHCCNDAGMAGAGVIISIENKWPKAIRAYRKWYNDSQVKGKKAIKQKMALGMVQTVPVTDQITICNIIGQVWGYKNGVPPVRYAAILTGLKKIRKFYIEEGMTGGIHLPLMGARLAGGDWNLIETLIIEVFCTDEHDIPVKVYDLTGDAVKARDGFNVEDDYDILDVADWTVDDESDMGMRGYAQASLVDDFGGMCDPEDDLPTDEEAFGLFDVTERD